MSNYRRGARVEILVADALGECGYDVIRSAGSKGGADLVAFSESETLLVQVKMREDVRVTPAERRELLRLASRVSAAGSRVYPLVAYRAPDPADKRRTVVVYRQLTDTGPKDWLAWIPMREGGDDDGR